MAKTFSFGFLVGAALSPNFERTFSSAGRKIKDLGEAANRIKGDAGFRLGNDFLALRDKVRGSRAALTEARTELARLKSQAEATGRTGPVLARALLQAESRVKTLESSLRGNISQFIAQRGQMAMTGQSLRPLVQGYRQASREVDALTAKQAALSANLARTKERFERSGELRGQIMGTAAMAVGAGAPVKDAMGFEHSLRMTGNIADLSDTQISSAAQQLLEISRKTNQSKEDVAQAWNTLLGKGMSSEEAMATLTPIARAATATGASVEDLAKTTFSLMDNLKLGSGDIEGALDSLAKAGKEGSFELRDMAQFFPQLTAQAQALGLTGPRAVASLGAALQVAMKGAGDPAEAANNMRNYLAKITAPETIKHFAEKGINLEAEFRKAQASGRNPLEYTMELVHNLTGGDKFRIGELFGDMQVANYLTPLMANLQEYRRIRDESMGASGTVDRDFQNMMSTPLEKTKALTNSASQLGLALGGVLSPAVGWVADRMSGWAQGLYGLSQSFPRVTTGVGAVVAGLVVLKAGFLVGSLALNSFMGLFSVSRLVLFRVGQLAVASATGILTAAQWAWNAAMTANPIGLVVAGVAILGGAAYALWKNWDWVSEKWTAMWDGMASAARACLDSIKDIPVLGRVAGWFSGDDPAQAGAKVQRTMAAGVASEKGALAAAMDDSFAEADAFMPHSDADKGPFSRLTESGRALIQTMALGAAGAGPTLAQTLSAIFGLGDGGGGLSLAGAAGGGGGIVLNVSIGEIRAGDPGAVREAAREGLTAAMPDVRRAFEDYLHGQRRTALAR